MSHWATNNKFDQISVFDSLRFPIRNVKVCNDRNSFNKSFCLLWVDCFHLFSVYLFSGGFCLSPFPPESHAQLIAWFYYNIVRILYSCNDVFHALSNKKVWGNILLRRMCARVCVVFLISLLHHRSTLQQNYNANAQHAMNNYNYLITNNYY